MDKWSRTNKKCSKPIKSVYSSNWHKLKIYITCLKTLKK